MIIDFRAIGHDIYDKIEQPVLTVKTPDGRVISTVSNYYGLRPVFRFNDVSEVEFTVPAFFEDEANNGYADLIGARLVEVEPFGDFVLINPVVNNEGGKKELKTCKAYSLEYKFNFKKAEIPAGTYNFYNPVENDDTITHIITEMMPDWSFGQIDRELIGRWRTFENVDDNLYSFMMNTLQESYNCLFLFDTFNKKINVMSANRSASKLPIYLSYNNLLKSVDITELTDGIVTALSGYGSGDEVSIAPVNPNGTNTIYNLDYFISNGDLPEALADKWIAYDNMLDLYREIYSNLGVLQIQKQNEYQLALAKGAVIQTDYDAVKTTYLTAQTAPKDPNTIDEYNAEIERLKTELAKLESELAQQNAQIELLIEDLGSINKQIMDVVSICKPTSYFTADEYKILSQYFIQDSIADDTFVIPEYSSAVLDSTSNALNTENEGVVRIVGAEIYASNIAEVFQVGEDGTYSAYVTDDESGVNIYNSANLDKFNDVEIPEDIAQTVADQLNDEAKRKTYEFRGGILEFSYTDKVVVNGETTDKEVKIKGDVVNVNLHYNVANMPSYENAESPDITKAGFYMLTATLRNAEYNGTSYPNMNLSMQGMLKKGKPNIGDKFVDFVIDSAVIYNTASNTEYQKQAIIQELYDYVNTSLEKLAFPSYEFTVESSNFIFAKEFEPFKNQLQLGSTINLALDDNEDNIIQPILIEIGLNYDDESEFSILFSNKYRSSSSEFQLADLITELNRTSHSTTLNKGDYRAYKDSKAGNQVNKLTNSALDVTRNKIINSVNQSIEWDSTGMFFRKALPNGGYDPKQIGMINDNIAFTKDNWDSVEIAIGAYEDPNLGEGYGIIAPAIFGTLFAGENLVIENTVDDGSGNTVKQFKVDSTGAWLHNSSLAFTQEADPNTGYAGGKLLIDPRYGIAAGNQNLFTLNGTDVSPSFWDSETNKIIWDETEVIETADGSVYYTPLNTQFYFDINTGDAYFSGTINGKNIIAETINGQAIKPNSLSGGTLIDGSINAGTKLTGDIPKDQMYKNILESINKFADIAREGDIISLNLIGGLTNINFEGGKITADEVDASKITGDLIEAINASIGTIDADRLNVTSAIEAAKVIVSGENGKLAITPEYGIVAGNADLFTLNDDGSITPSFINGAGELIIDDATKAPLNSSFYFDINTGNAYYTGSINAGQINAGKLSSDYLDVKDAFITNAMIDSLSANKITSGTIATDLLTANVINAINASIQTIDASRINTTQLNASYAQLDFANIGEAAIRKLFADTGLISSLGMENGHVTGVLSSVKVTADVIDANTITADKLLLKGNNGLFYRLNTDGVSVSTEEVPQTIENSLSGSILTAESVTADKIYVSDLYAFGATIGGFEITDSTINSVGKVNINSPAQGIYMDKLGQFALGNNSDFIRYYKDGDNWKLRISASEIMFGGEYELIEDALAKLKKEVATVLRIESSHGLIFKNNTASTVLSAIVQHGNLKITTQSMLTQTLGPTARLQWKQRGLSHNDYVNIPSTDSRLSENGFKLTLSPNDVDRKVTFSCELIV